MLKAMFGGGGLSTAGVRWLEVDFSTERRGLKFRLDEFGFQIRRKGLFEEV